MIFVLMFTVHMEYSNQIRCHGINRSINKFFRSGGNWRKTKDYENYPFNSSST